MKHEATTHIRQNQIVDEAGFLWRRRDPVLTDRTRRVEAVGPTARHPGSSARPRVRRLAARVLTRSTGGRV
ncbi:MAG: hypothetical protein OXM00_03260 [Paracoccaceae bacterium]|nr:hypothetical protein [Paracoccaceae bacterium]